MRKWGRPLKNAVDATVLKAVQGLNQSGLSADSVEGLVSTQSSVVMQTSPKVCDSGWLTQILPQLDGNQIDESTLSNFPPLIPPVVSRST